MRCIALQANCHDIYLHKFACGLYSSLRPIQEFCLQDPLLRSSCSDHPYLFSFKQRFLENLPHGDHHRAILNTVYLVLGVCGIPPLRR